MYRESIMFLSKTSLTIFSTMLKYFMGTEIKNTITDENQYTFPVVREKKNLRHVNKSTPDSSKSRRKPKHFQKVTPEI